MRVRSGTPVDRKTVSAAHRFSAIGVNPDMQPPRRSIRNDTADV